MPEPVTGTLPAPLVESYRRAYSGSLIAVHRKHTAEWLFPQEKATFDRVSKGIGIGEPL